MIIKPYGHNILVEPETKKQVLVSGTGSLCEYGKVIAVGEEVHKIKVGDVIGYTVWGLNSLEVDDKKYYLVPSDPTFILAILVQE